MQRIPTLLYQVLLYVYLGLIYETSLSATDDSKFRISSSSCEQYVKQVGVHTVQMLKVSAVRILSVSCKEISMTEFSAFVNTGQVWPRFLLLRQTSSNFESWWKKLPSITQFELNSSQASQCLPKMPSNTQLAENILGDC